MHPKPGVDRKTVITALRQSAMDARNVASTSHGALRLRDNYVQWADLVERTLGFMFTDFRLADLQTDRFWHIREVTEETARPYELIYPEVEAQATRLEQLASELEAKEQRLGGTEGRIVVPDTNVFLHFQMFNTIDWPILVGSSPVRLVIPIRVVEELDLKKASRRRDLAKRARAVLVVLESLVGPTGGLPAKMSDSATVEVLIDHELESIRRTREASPDAEILDACEFLAFVTGNPVSLVTGDVSMRLRATVEGWTALPMPEALSATLDPEVSAQPSPGG